jgi:hypothetical protein
LGCHAKVDPNEHKPQLLCSSGKLRAACRAWPVCQILPSRCAGNVGTAPRYDNHTLAALAGVPVILVGRVIENCKPVGKVHPSRWDGYPYQLWKVDVKVEHVLQGDVTTGELPIYYFAYLGNLGSSDFPLVDLAAGDYVMFFLQRDNGLLRTICDGWHNCAVKVRTGAHPNYKRSQSPTIADAIYDVILTRGPTGTDEQLILTMRRSRLIFDQGAEDRALERLARTETAPVAEVACGILSHRPQPKPCPQPTAQPATSPHSTPPPAYPHA